MQKPISSKILFDYRLFDYWVVGLLGFRSAGLSDYWCPSFPTAQYSDNFELLDCRTTETLSDFWVVDDPYLLMNYEL